MLRNIEFANEPRFHTSSFLGAYLTVVLSACGGSSSSDGREVLTYKATGSLQCGPNATTQENLNVTVSALKAAGVTVNSASCGSTGNPAPAVCGIPNGDIWVIAVSEESFNVAQAQGFVTAAGLPQLITTPCRVGGA